MHFRLYGLYFFFDDNSLFSPIVRVLEEDAWKLRIEKESSEVARLKTSRMKWDGDCD